MGLQGKKCPDFINQATGGSQLSSKDLVVKTWYILHPKDNTPGCTLEGQDFRDNYKN